MLQCTLVSTEPIICSGQPDFRILEDGWTAVTLDSCRSAQFEHTVLITEDGAQILTLWCLYREINFMFLNWWNLSFHFTFGDTVSHTLLPEVSHVPARCLTHYHLLSHTLLCDVWCSEEEVTAGERKTTCSIQMDWTQFHYMPRWHSGLYYMLRVLLTSQNFHAKNLWLLTSQTSTLDDIKRLCWPYRLSRGNH